MWLDPVPAHSDDWRDAVESGLGLGFLRVQD